MSSDQVNNVCVLFFCFSNPAFDGKAENAESSPVKAKASLRPNVLHRPEKPNSNGQGWAAWSSLNDVELVSSLFNVP